MMPLDPYFTSKAKPVSVYRKTPPEESDAAEIGRDDAGQFKTGCPFEAGSEDARLWREAKERKEKEFQK